MKTLAVIPARAGSKGIPGKNLRLMAGHPLIAHAIRSSFQSRYVDRVIVSTDCQEIARVSQLYGAEIIWRPLELCGDTASSESALLHVLSELDKHGDYRPDILVFLQCTSPLTSPSDIDNTVQLLLNEDADSSFAAVPFHYFLWGKNANGALEGINHDLRKRPLRQERATISGIWSRLCYESGRIPSGQTSFFWQDINVYNVA